jgi:hypothetical protein
VSSTVRPGGRTGVSGLVEGGIVKLRWRNDRRAAGAATAPRTFDVTDEEMAADQLASEPGGLGAVGGLGATAAPEPARGPVMLSLTTREQVEKAAAAEAAPKIVRVRPGRGAFGGAASGGGCGPGGCSH